jgi:abequosyltransferase
MGNNIILSICIPTFNRAQYLEETLLSIVNQKRFKETFDIEIVISDNCSKDNTNEVSQKFIGMYGEKIRYFRNSENIDAANLEKILSYGRGEFLKLNNDTLQHKENSLEKIIETVQHNIKNRQIIFFSNGTLKNISVYQCKNLDSFIKTVSFYSTWIACFGIWREDFLAIDNFDPILKLNLINDVLFKQIISNRNVVVDNTKIFDSISPSLKGGYNIYEVFVANYLGLLKSYRIKNQISRMTLFNEKTKLMMNFLIPWTLILWRNTTQYSFDRKGAVKIIYEEYRFHPVLFVGIVYLFLKILRIWIKDMFSLSKV